MIPLWQTGSYHDELIAMYESLKREPNKVKHMQLARKSNREIDLMYIP